MWKFIAGFFLGRASSGNGGCLKGVGCFILGFVLVAGVYLFSFLSSAVDSIGVEIIIVVIILAIIFGGKKKR